VSPSPPVSRVPHRDDIPPRLPRLLTPADHAAQAEASRPHHSLPAEPDLPAAPRQRDPQAPDPDGPPPDGPETIRVQVTNAIRVPGTGEAGPGTFDVAPDVARELIRAGAARQV